ncbi:septum formation initiator family protein [Rickettsia endosymbiont of Gonocerus acuteangulatus]|uniref:FtsB family cell division protein n=1 Tax=Rickettsia endosymbiont of Gonocerus acuteangulatus TaxID=3066266 RepID=UPI00313339DE
MSILNLIISNNHTKKIILNIFLALLLGYFVFHCIYGNKGVIAYLKVNRQLEKAYDELKLLRAERVELEHNVKLLRTESLDKDMLDEQARKVLGIAAPNEQVFNTNSKP